MSRAREKLEKVTTVTKSGAKKPKNSVTELNKKSQKKLEEKLLLNPFPWIEFCICICGGAASMFFSQKRQRN
jgi:hypothetical protein